MAEIQSATCVDMYMRKMYTYADGSCYLPIVASVPERNREMAKTNNMDKIYEQNNSVLTFMMKFLNSSVMYGCHIE